MGNYSDKMIVLASIYSNNDREALKIMRRYLDKCDLNQVSENHMKSIFLQAKRRASNANKNRYFNEYIYVYETPFNKVNHNFNGILNTIRGAAHV